MRESQTRHTINEESLRAKNKLKNQPMVSIKYFLARAELKNRKKTVTRKIFSFIFTFLILKILKKKIFYE